MASEQLGEGEEVVLRMREHPKALIVPLLLLVAALLAAAFLTAAVPEGARGPVGAFASLAALAAIVWWTLRPAVLWLTTSYVLTDRRLITKRGILTRSGHVLPLTRVADVSYELGLIDRVFGCGTLIVSDASEYGQIELHDIPDVQRVQLLLSDLSQGRPSGDRTEP